MKKFKGIAFIALAVIGAIYVWHMYSQHGGVAGFKSGLGLH